MSRHRGRGGGDRGVQISRLLDAVRVGVDDDGFGGGVGGQVGQRALVAQRVGAIGVQLETNKNVAVWWDFAWIWTEIGV